MRRSRLNAAVGSLAICALIITASCGPQTHRVAYGVEQRRSGFLAHDTFTMPEPVRNIADRFEFNGDAGPQVGFIRSNTSGLVVGLKRHNGSDYRGWFAVTYDAFPATAIYHVRMSLPIGTVRRHEGIESVFAVQTASTKMTGLINYVVVAAQTLGAQTRWQIGYAHGRLVNAQTTIFWSRPATSSYEDITLRTDGRRSLTVWFGRREVFSSNTLDMQIEAPFQPYLEVQARDAADEAQFSNFWITDAGPISLAGLPSGAVACLETRMSTAPVACAVASPTGQAELQPSPPNCSGDGTIAVRDGPRTGGFAYACGSNYRVTAG